MQFHLLVGKNGREVFGDVNVQHCGDVLVLLCPKHIEYAHLNKSTKVRGQRSPTS